MRTKCTAFLAGLFLLGLLIPLDGAARTATILGSLTITKVLPDASRVALTTELVGISLIANPGFEMIIPQQLPPFTIPAFVDVDQEDTSDSAGRRILRKRFETTLVLTNTTGTSLSIELTLWGPSGAGPAGNGNPLNKLSRTLDPHATLVLFLSDLLP